MQAAAARALLLGSPPPVLARVVGFAGPVAALRLGVAFGGQRAETLDTLRELLGDPPTLAPARSVSPKIST